ncbi:MAG: WXG100 family type VII secretion target [Oscillospiraceae bacterium]|nr:WXG100 family type VII secretion target [Oscillospiraceae bacterium]
MSYFMVTASQLRAKAEELRQSNEQFKSQVNTLNDQEAHLGAMWEGESKNAFHNAFQRDKAQMDNFFNAIAQYVNALESIAQKYEEAERQNIEIASNRTY